MSYQVFCTFDLANASSQDYEDAYADLSDIGLARVVVSGKGKDVVIPTTSAIGDFNGQSVVQVRDDIREQVKAAFKKRGFSSEIFRAVGEDGTWGAPPRKVLLTMCWKGVPRGVLPYPAVPGKTL